MSSFVDSLNLRPQEKRILVGLGVIIFGVLNMVFVFPHFHDWKKINDDLNATKVNITNFTKKIEEDNAPGTGLKAQVRILEKQQEGGIQTHETEIALNQAVTAEAKACGFIPQSISPTEIRKLGTASQSDKYFVSQSVQVVAQTSEEALVKFLYDMGNDPAMIRVFQLTLGPADQNARYQLHGTITLTADYQRTVDTNAPPPPKPVATNVLKTVIVPAPPNRGAAPVKANAPPGTVRRGQAGAPPPPGPPGLNQARKAPGKAQD